MDGNELSIFAPPKEASDGKIVVGLRVFLTQCGDGQLSKSWSRGPSILNIEVDILTLRTGQLRALLPSGLGVYGICHRSGQGSRPLVGLETFNQMRP